MATLMQQKFGNLTQQNRKPANPKAAKMFNYLEQNDRRMRFNNAQDPIYYIFDCIENRPIKVLAKEFVKDAVRDTIGFISSAIL